MQSSQPCSSGDLSGEPGLHAVTAGLNNAAIHASLPGFSLEQVNSLTKLFLDILNDPEPTPPSYQMPIFVAVPGSYLKYKRNVRTRQQYKKKAKALRITSQEVEQSDVYISVEKDGKHVVLKRKSPLDCVATLLYAIIAFVGIIPMIMVHHELIGMRRMGVG